MLALGAPGRLEAALQRAGFRDVAVERVAVARGFPSAAAAVENLLETYIPLRGLLADASEAERAGTAAEIEAALRRFDGPGGLWVPGEFLLGVGTK
jgi:hypothetical protein